MPMQRIIGGIKIHNDLFRWCGEDVQKSIHQELFNFIITPLYFIVAITVFFSLFSEFKPVQRTFTGKRIAIFFGADQGEQRIMAPLVMIVEVFIPLA